MIEERIEMSFDKVTKNFDVFKDIEPGGTNHYYAQKGKYDKAKNIVVTIRQAD